MKVVKTICFLSVLIVSVFAAQNAMALPGTAYVDDDGKNWMGYKTYTPSGYDVVLEWKVYEMADNPWAASIDFPDGDNFIYAYQLFSSELSTKDIGYFGVRDSGGNPILETLMHATQSRTDGAGGVMTDPQFSAKQGEWTWMPGTGFVSAGAKSAFLIFSSVFGPVTGSFVVSQGEQSDGGVPGEDVPEPSSLALLIAASGWFISRRTKNRNK